MAHGKNAGSAPREGGEASVDGRGLLILSHDVDGVSIYWDGPTDPPFDVITVYWDIDCHELDDITGGIELQDESGITVRASTWREAIHNLASDKKLLQAVRAHRAGFAPPGRNHPERSIARP